MLPAGSEGRLHRCSPLISHSKCVSVSSSGQMEDAACTADDDLSSHVSHTLGRLHDGIRTQRSWRSCVVGNQPGVWQVCELVADGKDTH